MSGWNESALLTAYRQGLDSQICTQMAIYDDKVWLENFMLRAVWISQCITACRFDDTALPPVFPPAGYPIPEPIQMDATRLTRIKWAQRLSSSLCLYCGSSGHFIWTCPTHPPHPGVNTPPALRVLLLEPCPSGAELWHREQGIAGH